MWKPNLTPAMKEARLAFAVKYKDWTIEDWKRVIWTDETSVVLGQQRGNHWVWRTPLCRKRRTYCINRKRMIL